MESITNEKTVSLKLMINKRANKVAFAEAGQEFLDMIHRIMSLPLSTFTRLLSANGMGGPLNSISNLNFESGEGANSELKPRTTPEERVKDGVVYMVSDNLEVKPLSLALIKPYDI
ncbi:hypothetical protein RND81_08G213500 [Saponaria officinalis]|uniref:Uncharacterized protein n=1 Tax=Saponaria officinalis TaxID=3572 RepID=A0AAW1J9J2_SAPOF